MKRKKNIICVTGTRADYPRVKPVLNMLKLDKSIKLSLYVTGQHLEKDFGKTINEIKKDKFKILRKIKIFSKNDKLLGMNQALTRCIKKISNYLCLDKPDLVLLTVDRIETFGSAIAAFTSNFPIAHIQGGEVTGTMDETIRHCVTKMSHIHFAATEKSRNRIICMGENIKNVHNVGCPYVDHMKNFKVFSHSKIERALKNKLSKNFAIFIQHPVTSELKDNFNNFLTTVKSLKKFKNLQIISIYSNSDAGGRKINDYLKKNTNFLVFKNLHEDIFLSLMSKCKFMIGNSSSGIREAEIYKVPVINIGTRQNGRERNINVIDVDYKKIQIIRAINKCLYDRVFLKKIKKIKNLYGNGKASWKIVKLLKKQYNIGIQKIFHDNI